VSGPLFPQDAGTAEAESALERRVRKTRLEALTQPRNKRTTPHRGGRSAPTRLIFIERERGGGAPEQISPSPRPGHGCSRRDTARGVVGGRPGVRRRPGHPPRAGAVRAAALGVRPRRRRGGRGGARRAQPPHLPVPLRRAAVGAPARVPRAAAPGLGALPHGGLQGPPRLRRAPQGVPQLGDPPKAPRPPPRRGRIPGPRARRHRRRGGCTQPPLRALRRRPGHYPPLVLPRPRRPRGALAGGGGERQGGGGGRGVRGRGEGGRRRRGRAHEADPGRRAKIAQMRKEITDIIYSVDYYWSRCLGTILGQTCALAS
jgi:hypothetical protein